MVDFFHQGGGGGKIYLSIKLPPGAPFSQEHIS